MAEEVTAEQTTDKASHDLKSCEPLKLEELTKLQIISIALSGDFDQIHRRNKEVGAVVMKFHDFFEWHKVLVETMRDLMKPKHGSKKRTLVDGEMLTWGEYCKKYYGVGHDWVARMIRAEHKQDTPEPDEAAASVSTETPKPKTKEKKVWVKMEKADYDKALNEQWNKGVMSAGLTPEEVVRKLMDAEDEYESYKEKAAYDQGVADAQAKDMLKLADAKHEAHIAESKSEPADNPEPNTRKAKRWYKVGDDSRSLGIGSKNDLRAQGKRSHDEPLSAEELEAITKCAQPVRLDSKDPYAYFEQFKDEAQTMASELAAMLLDFHLDEQQTTSLLDLLKKQLKAQRKALAAA